MSVATQEFLQIHQCDREEREFRIRRNILMSTNRHGAPNFQQFVLKNKQMILKLMKIENLFAKEKTYKIFLGSTVIALSIWI